MCPLTTQQGLFCKRRLFMYSLSGPKGLRYLQVIIQSAVVSSLRRHHIWVVALLIEASSTSVFVYEANIEQCNESNARHPETLCLTAKIRSIEQLSYVLPGVGCD